MKLRTAIWTVGASTGLLGPACAQVFTGPYGPGGTWNAYQVVTTVATWQDADTAAKAKTAASTNLPSLAGNNLTGHLVQLASEDENTFVALLAAQGVNSGNSNIWIGLNDINAEQGTNRTGWEWSGTTGGSGTDGAQVLGVDTEFSAWFPGEPNNSTTENAGEMRTDGRWNDNKQALSTTTRRYVVEWETASATPIEGAMQIPVYYTAPHGAGGKWNLYRVVATATNNFTEANDIAASTTAGSTGVTGVNNGALTGHISSINSAAENDFIFRIANHASNNSVTTWLGATDDPAFSGVEAGSSKTNGWVWAGTTEPFTYQKFRRRYPNNAEEPNNAGTGENFTIMRTLDSYWDDVAESAAGTTAGTFRRYVVEWNTEQDAPISGAALVPSVLPGVFPTLAGTDANGTWDVRITRGVANGGANMFNALGVVYGYNVTGAAATNGTQPVLSGTDGVTGTDLAGRATTGLFWPRLPYVGDVAGDDNQFVVLAKTKVVIPADGLYAFNVHSDDGHHFSLSGGPANGYQLLQVDGLGIADTSAAGGFYYPINNDGTGARGIYQMQAGTYTVEYFGNEGGSGSMFEVAWAPVPASWVPGTDLGNWGADWKLLGGSVGGTPVVPAGQLNVPAAAGAQWSVDGLAPVATAYANIKAAGAAFQAGAPVNPSTAPVLNFADPQNAGNRGRFGNDAPFPSEAGVDEERFVTGARGKLTITEPGVYTVAARVDDWFAVRVSAPATVRGRVWGVTAAGHIDSNDAQTAYWDVGTSDTRVAIHFPTAGVYDLDVLHVEGTGGSSFELSYAKGVFPADADTNSWRLIGDLAALTPVLPATVANGPEFGNRTWGVHTVHNTGTQLDTMTEAVAALQAVAGDHTSATSPVLNFIDPQAPGVGGIFAGDIPVPGDTADVNDDDFALHARGKLEVATAGIYTFAVKNSDGFALRIKGASWLTNVTGVTGAIDPADTSTFVLTPGTAALNDRTSRASVSLAAGTYEVDFVTFDRGADFHAEVYVARGQNAGTAEYATLGTAAAASSTAGGGAAITLTDGWRLVGYTPAGLATLGMNREAGLGAVGWKVEQTAPQAAAPTAVQNGGFTWGTLAAADSWFTNAPSTVTVQGVDQINYNDPGFGGTGIFPNDQPNPTNTPATNATNTDDHYYTTRMTGILVVPTDGTYSIGFNSDDGQYFEFVGTGTNIPVFTRLVANATATSAPALPGTIVTSTDGVEGARFEVNGGTGSSRCIAEVQLTAGNYPVRAVWFEGTGGSFNEVFAAPSPPWGRPISLLIESIANAEGVITSGAMADVPDINGLTLAPSDVVPPTAPLDITAFVKNPNGSVTITWSSEANVNYTVETSPNLQTPWTTVSGPTTATGTSTSYTSPVLDTANVTRLFWRVRRP